MDVFNQMSTGLSYTLFNHDFTQVTSSGGMLCLNQQAGVDWCKKITFKQDGGLDIRINDLSVTQVDLESKTMMDYFCIGSDIRVRMPTPVNGHFEAFTPSIWPSFDAIWQFSFVTLTIRYWTDFSPSEVAVIHEVPKTTQGTWSKEETSGWTVDGSVGFFGNQLTASQSHGVSFASSYGESLPDLVAEEHLRNNNPEWEFRVNSLDTNLAGPSQSVGGPTLDFGTEFLLRARSAGIRPKDLDWVIPPDSASLDEIPPAPAGIAMTRDGKPGMRVYLQAVLTMQAKDQGNHWNTKVPVFMNWVSPVDSIVVPYAPPPKMQAKEGKISVFNDGGIFFDSIRNGDINAILVGTQVDPANNTALQAGIDAKNLSHGTDWMSPGFPKDLGDSAFVEMVVHTKGSATTQSVRIARDPGANPDETDDFRLVPLSVLLDLSVHGGDPVQVRKTSLDWLARTGWKAEHWSSQSPQWQKIQLAKALAQ